MIAEYSQQVSRVLQSIQVLQAQNQAAIANITAGGQARAKTIVGTAKAQVFEYKQGILLNINLFQLYI